MIDVKVLDKALAAAEKKVKPPKVARFEWAKSGRFNAVGLPVVPHAVVQVADGSKGKLDYIVKGQQVIISGVFVAPVVIEYITEPEYLKWRSAMIDAVPKEIAKL